MAISTDSKVNLIGHYDIYENILLLSKIEAEQGNYKDAYLHYKEYQKIQDSIFSQENKNKIASIAASREIMLKDKELEVNKMSLKMQKKQQISLIVGIVLLLIIGGLLYRQSQIRKSKNFQLIALKTMEILLWLVY